MTFKILPYKQGSKSAKALATALGCKVLKLEGSKYKYKTTDIIINWGRTVLPEWNIDGNVLNAYGLDFASNKLKFFDLMKNENYLPTFWTNKEDIPDEAFPIVCRTVLSGHSGVGIVIADTRDDLVPAPLYVTYVKKKEEYRVHVGRVSEKNGYPYSEGDPYSVIIAAQKKARKLDVPCEEVNWQVRNLKGGFIYKRNGFSLPDQVRDVAIKAFEKTGLDFGAVDVIMTSKGVPYVLEINTAPGLEGQTIEDYAKFFKGLV